METLKCIIKKSSVRNLPEFDFKLIFENEFFRDEYTLETDKGISNLYKQTKYNIRKNEEFIGSLLMENYNIDEFMEKFICIIDDYDVKRLFEKNVKKELFEHYNGFIDIFETDIKKRPNNIIGEIYKMRRVAGLIN
jgi:hypothetical protein